MSANHPFVAKVLSVKDMTPLHAAASISGERMYDMANNTKHEPPPRSSVVVANGLALPERDSETWESLPEYLKLRKGARSDLVRNARNTLWLKVAWQEKRADSQFARLLSMPLPSSLPLERSTDALAEFAKNALVADGMIVDYAIHETIVFDDVPKRQAFALATTRRFKKGAFTSKDRSWNEKATLIRWREQWFAILLGQMEAAIGEDPARQVALAPWINLAKRFAPIGKLPENGDPQPADDPFGIMNATPEQIDAQQPEPRQAKSYRL